MSPRRRPLLDHQRMEVLDREEARDLLALASVGRVAFVEDGEVTVVPVNHVVDAWAIAFRTTYGSKLTAAVRGQRVAFEADRLDPAERTGWSVLVRGEAERVTDPTVVGRLEDLALDVWADAVDRPQWVRIPIDEISGRRIPTADDPRIERD